MTAAPEPVLVDAAAAALAVGRGMSTVYRWGQRGLIARAGRDTAGRWLYDLDEVQRYADAHPPITRPRNVQRT